MFDFVDKECMNNCINTKYQLYAILNHSGNLDEGHFYSFINTFTTLFEQKSAFFCRFFHLKTI